jgi:hypothetical protein
VREPEPAGAGPAAAVRVVVTTVVAVPRPSVVAWWRRGGGRVRAILLPARARTAHEPTRRRFGRAHEI